VRRSSNRVLQRAPEHSGYRIKVEEWMHFIDKSVKMTDDVRLN
jgi:hypothetical protein